MSNSSFFDFHCPLGGTWYACATGSNFVGCCTEDPCSKGCVQGNIRSGAYNVSHFSEWPDASCGSASDFYTCSAGDTFWGCCKSNPCAANPPATCVQGDLVPAFMERPEQFSAYTPTSAESASSKKSNTAAIAGGVVGGVVGLAIIGALIWFFLRKKRRNQKTAGSEMTPMTQEKPKERLSEQFVAQSPPPTYSAPAQDFYQNMSPNKGHESYHQYASMADGPQELPAETPSHNETRYSELSAEGPSSKPNHRISELPAGATRVAELESPGISPMPVQSEFKNQGLGVTTEGGSTR